MLENIFREAKELLDTKDGRKMTEEEQELVSAAMIPLNILPHFNDMTIGEGLEELARIVDEAIGIKHEETAPAQESHPVQPLLPSRDV